MNVSQAILDEAESLLATLPSLSRPIIQNYFRQAFDVEHKEDDSPVTIADMQVETALRAAITQHFPEHAIIGEEQGGRADADLCWVIDPIDGTKAFITGNPLFGTLVGLSDSGVPVCGLIDIPALGETYLTEKGASYLITQNTRKRIHTRPCHTLEYAHIATTSPEAFTPKGWQQFNWLRAACDTAHFGGDCYNYALLAAGHLDIVLEHQLAAHDFTALIPVLQNAGAVVTDWSGNPVRLNGDGSVLAAATPRLHASALELLQAFPPSLNE